jgi:hypothetical protein
MIIHMAGKINAKGQVSAICFDPPRAIKLAVASWTLLDRFVTCKKCKKLIETRAKAGK